MLESFARQIFTISDTVARSGAESSSTSNGGTRFPTETPVWDGCRPWACQALWCWRLRVLAQQPPSKLKMRAGRGGTMSHGLLALHPAFAEEQAKGGTAQQCGRETGAACGARLAQQQAMKAQRKLNQPRATQILFWTRCPEGKILTNAAVLRLSLSRQHSWLLFLWRSFIPSL